MESAQGYGPWFVGVRIFSGVPYAGVVESGLWRSPRKREAANTRPWVQILPPAPFRKLYSEVPFVDWGCEGKNKLSKMFSGIRTQPA